MKPRAIKRALYLAILPSSAYLTSQTTLAIIALWPFGTVTGLLNVPQSMINCNSDSQAACQSLVLGQAIASSHVVGIYTDLVK